jgi:3-deoxy-7-phosphoheptulonate synthase
VNVVFATYETATRNTLDLNAVALAKKRTHLPIIVDPSHGTGKWYLVAPMALAGLAAGADGLMIEVHPIPIKPPRMVTQSLNLENFATLMPKITALAGVLH